LNDRAGFIARTASGLMMPKVRLFCSAAMLVSVK
jgi:hypothetical protein